MAPNTADFVHPSHLPHFIEAARVFNCHILVRETGRSSLNWVGRSGYTGKRADMKAKTANRDVGRYQLAGLVCAPHLQPRAFSADRLSSAQAMWRKSAHLITEPDRKAGFDDHSQTPGCRTSYVLQNNPNHRHFGCIALVEMGLLVPRYVHGDYDLYAIIPAGETFDPEQIQPRLGTLGSTMSLDHLGLADRLAQEQALKVDNMEGPLSFRVANHINNCIDRAGGDLMGALMVNHGEQVNLVEGRDFQTVLAISPGPRQAGCTRILASRDEHEAFYRNA